MLGPEYAKVQLFVNPSDAGHDGVARPRTYIIYYNKVKLEIELSLMRLNFTTKSPVKSKRLWRRSPRIIWFHCHPHGHLIFWHLLESVGWFSMKFLASKITQNIMKHTFWEVDGNRMTSSCATMCYGYVPLGRLLALTRLVDPDLPRASMSLKSCWLLVSGFWSTSMTLPTRRSTGPPQSAINRWVYFLGDRFEFSKTWSAHSGRIPTYRKNSAKYLHRSSMQVYTGQ